MPRPLLAALALTLAAGAAQAQTPTYRVYPLPVESPAHTTPLPPADARALVTDPSDAAASPFDWHDTDGAPGPEHTTTQGNNAVVWDDLNGDGAPDGGELPDGGPTLTFDFPLNLAQDPTTYGPAAATNVFHLANVFHDVLYGYGFTEAAGNFQQNTYGRGGLGGDPFHVAIHTASISITLPADGAPALLRLPLQSGAPRRDLALDAGIVLHELAHGVSSRLTGGPANAACLGNAEQPGEGWSDWYALMLTMRPGDTGLQRRGLGTYLLGQPSTGNGIRPAPYSTDFAANNYTYQRTRTLSAGLGTGFVWASILWEVTWAVIGAHGFDPDLYDADGGAGNQRMLTLVTEAMKLQPCSPGFVDARDAILAADQALYGGAHRDLLWTAFARRGLGFSASQGSSASNADNTEAFDLPPGVAGEPGAPAAALLLGVPSPNPAAGAARVAFTLPAGGTARLALYDLTGRQVAVLAEGALAAGPHEVAVDVRGLAASSYVLRLEAGGAARTQRLTVAR